MSATPAQPAADFLALFDARAEDSFHEARASAARAFAAAGIPGRRLEAWKYTDLRPLAALPVRLAPEITDVARLAAMLPAIAAPRIVFVNGKFSESLSTFSDGKIFSGLAAAPSLASHENAPLAALNTMLAEDGAVIRVPENVDGGTLVLVHLTIASVDAPVFSASRYRIDLAPGAALNVIEYSSGQGVYWNNPVSEIALAEGARLGHVRIQAESVEGFQTATLFADLLGGARYEAFTLGLGARLARSETQIRLAGAGAIAHMDAAQLLAGAQHGDVTTVVAHDAPGCASRQTVKNVLDGRARAVFQGRIEVARAAQKTDGYQMSQALLLSPDAEIDCKPELEIFADDVKCSHGATVGALDPEQMFYLRARGIPGDLARRMLIRAFLAEAIENVADVPARALLEDTIDAWWEQGR